MLAVLIFEFAFVLSLNVLFVFAGLGLVKLFELAGLVELVVLFSRFDIFICKLSAKNESQMTHAV